MIEVLSSLASDASVLLRRDAVAAGIDDNALRRYVRAGTLVRIRQGAYALKFAWDAATPEVQHAMLVDAVMRQYDAHVVLSHASAAVLQGAPGWGLDLSNVHLTHLDGGGRIGGRVIHHHGSCRVNDVSRVNGHWITSPARTVHDIAMTDGAEAALVNASDFLHRGLTTIAELLMLEPARNTWPHTLGMNVVLHLADPRFESVGESRCRYLFWSQGLPAPVPQYEVFHPNGKLAGRVDFAWPELGLLLEFDGRSSTPAIAVRARHSNRPSSARSAARRSSARSQAGESSASPGPTSITRAPRQPGSAASSSAPPEQVRHTGTADPTKLALLG